MTELAAVVCLTLMAVVLAAIGYWASSKMDGYHIPTYTPRPPDDRGPAPDGGHVLQVVTHDDCTDKLERDLRKLERVA